MKRLGLCLLCCLLLCAGCMKEEPESATTFCADTVVTITAFDATAEQLRALLAACAGYDAVFSKTVEGSDVWRINHADGAPVKVDAAVIEALQTAQRVAALSGGAFDVTVAPASALWDFTGGTALLPDAAALSAAMQRVDYTRICIEGDAVTLPAGMQIDLGGVAKGYIADETIRLCRESGVAHAILNMGGNVAVAGAKPDGSGWRVGIQDPADPYGKSALTLETDHGSVVTSGIYNRGFELDGVRYHHILDTKSGYPVQNELASVTILSDDGALADALSTACMAMGLQKGMAMLDAVPEAEGIFILRDGTIHHTDGAANAIKADG
ncbi:MAG: FAD:protein FMN transferase [Clostridia bacterium]|nr:FAD:protein FMN transferase [Clostridia bacterium]